MSGHFMTDHRTNMQNNQDRQNDTGNIMGLFENSNESGTFKGRGNKKNVKYIDRPVHHHDPAGQHHARHQIHTFVNPISRPLRRCAERLSLLKKRKKNPDQKKRNKQCREGHIKKTDSLLEHPGDIK